ncbi:MAG: hypothetical protein RIQ93_1247 [Verrucomicrobiota bacterium]
MIKPLAQLRTVSLHALVVALALPLAGIAATLPGNKGPAIAPQKPIILFNGKDLSGFSTWLANHKKSDPNQVFRVVDQIDGAPAIRVSGEGFGGFITDNAYANYHLVVEYRWGSLTWGARKTKTMDSGILLHAQGREGASAADLNGPWMHSIEYQLIEGGTGDFIRVRGYTEDGKAHVPTFTSTVRLMRNGQFNYDPNGQVRTFNVENGGRLNWYGRDPDWKDELGFRGADDVEKPIGQWNKSEIICKGDTITSLLNGKIVNKATGCSLSEGRILFQTEGAEIFFRRIELHPIK